MRTDRIRIASRLYTKIMHYLTTLTIAGSDCSGGAGIQADIKTLSALGCYAASVITAVTVQNTCGVQSVYPLPTEIVRQQIRAVLSDLKPTAIKIGMLGNYEIARAVSEEIADYKETAQFVLDPIICSSNGHPLVTPDTIACMQDMLFPLCTLITPNLPETSKLTGITDTDETQLQQAAKQFFLQGTQAVLIKGGHRNGPESTDLLYTIQTPETPYHYSSPKIETRNTHGTGCTLSSAITAFLAQGYPLPEAVGEAKKYLNNALLSATAIHIGSGHGPLNHFFNPKKAIIRQ